MFPFRRLFPATIFVALILVVVALVGCAQQPAASPTAAPAAAPTKAPAAPAQPTAALAPATAAPAQAAPTTAPAKPAAAPTQPAAAKKPEGKLVIAVSTLGREIWTPLDGSMPEQYPASMWYDKLLLRGQGTDENLYPGLAEKWTVSDDLLTYTFNLRKGVQFNEGYGEFTADDVLFSFQLIGRKDSKNVSKMIVQDWVEKMEVLDPYTFRVKLKSPHPDFLMQVSNAYPFFMMVSKKYWEKAGDEAAMRHPIGTGPFVFKKHVVGDSIESEAVDNHWRKTPAFKQLIIKIVPEEGSRIAMLRAGEADIINNSPAFVEEIKKNGFEVLRNPGASYYHLLFGGQVLPSRAGYDPNSPWGFQEDPAKAERALKVRKAMSLAVNVPEIITRIFKGMAIQPPVHQFLPGARYTDPAWKVYPYDPEQAKKLLAEAGYPNGFSQTPKNYLTKIAGREDMPDVGEAVSMYLERNLGIKTDRVPMDFAAFRDRWYSRSEIHKFAISILGTTPNLDPAVYYQTASYTPAQAFHSFESLEGDKLIKDAVGEVNPEQRIKKERALGQHVYDNYLTLPVAAVDSVFGVSKQVAGWKMNSVTSYLHNLEFIEKK